jgi:hypothetical protein
VPWTSSPTLSVPVESFWAMAVRSFSLFSVYFALIPDLTAWINVGGNQRITYGGLNINNTAEDLYKDKDGRNAVRYATSTVPIAAYSNFGSATGSSPLAMMANAIGSMTRRTT